MSESLWTTDGVEDYEEAICYQDIGERPGRRARLSQGTIAMSNASRSGPDISPSGAASFSLEWSDRPAFGIWPEYAETEAEALERKRMIEGSWERDDG